MFRIIARLDIKGQNLIKSVQLDGVRIVGDPQERAKTYYAQGADELILIDAVASLYGRNHLTELIRSTAKDVFIPLTVAGGLRTLDDVEKVLNAGADKVAINTAVVARPQLITEVAKCFGSQCMILQLDAKKKDNGIWEVYYDCGREPTGLNAVDWAQQAVDLGAGEILLTSVDYEGTRLGYDIDLVNKIAGTVSVPVIACGGMGNIMHLVEVIQKGQADAAAMADILHVQNVSINEIKKEIHSYGIPVRFS